MNDDSILARNPLPQRVGFYLHTSWEFEYPFAVRNWKREDFANWCELMQRLGMNLLMLWPLVEVLPAPLSAQDEADLRDWKQIVEDAKASGLETWVTLTANSTTKPEIAAKPSRSRHYYPFRIDVRLDDETARGEYLAHRAAMLQVLDNADGYVTIDGDPGGYPGAKPEAFLQVLQADRAVLNRLGRRDAKIIPWLWCGWGSDWERNGVWKEPLEPLTAPLLDALKAGRENLAPLEFLPGRSIREGHANGRENFEIAERAGVIEESTLLTYEIIEFEPTPPAVAIQFDDIRRVLRQEDLLIQKSRGLMGNAQQPIMVLPNLYFFARAAADREYLNREDDDVLSDLAEFLGGDATLLIPAWDCLRRDLNDLPADLPQRVRASQLKAEVARCIPGGPEKYLEILSAFVQARIEVLQACQLQDDEAAMATGMSALEKWWNVHRYVQSGENGEEFCLEFTDPLLRAPLEKRAGKYCA